MAKGENLVVGLDTQEAVKQKEKQHKGLDKKTETAVSVSRIKMDLNDLKELVHEGSVDQKLSRDMVNHINVVKEKVHSVAESTDVQKMIHSLEYIQGIPNIDTLLPKPYRINQKEYLEALEYGDKKLQVLDKIDHAVDFLYRQGHSLDNLSIKKFALFTRFLHTSQDEKELAIIHDAYIDIKYTLQS